jgi:hypothetical protein
MSCPRCPLSSVLSHNRSPRLNDLTSYVRLPHMPASLKLLTVASEPIDDDQFSARQIEFIRQLFGYSAYLREHARTTPVSDAFLPAFVMLLEVMELNSALEARQCAAQLPRSCGSYSLILRSIRQRTWNPPSHNSSVPTPERVSPHVRSLDETERSCLDPVVRH